MKIIKIMYCNFWNGFDIYTSLIYTFLKTKFDITLTNNDPDLIIFSDFGDTDVNKYACLKLYFSGESYTNISYKYDFSITYNHDTYNNLYFPLFLINQYSDSYNSMLNHSISIRNKFCSACISNKNSIDRLKFIQQLCSYKSVDLAGSVYVPRTNKYSIGKQISDKLDFDSKHKFAICFENKQQENYVTEKIVQAFAAGCIPIYRGDPNVSTIFNENAFLNGNDISNTELINKIKYIDNNDDAYNRMLLEQPLLDIEYKNKMIIKFNDFMNKIVEVLNK